MIKNYKKGFTLIELLVVIAIIGILASVVLISTSKTRESGNNASVQANLGTIKLQAEMVNTANRCYGNGADCTAAMGSDCSADLFTAAIDPILNKALLSANKAAGGTVDNNGLPTAAKCVVTKDGAAYAVAVNLRPLVKLGDPQTAWCIDSTGFSEMIPDISTFNASDNGTCE